MHVVLLPCITQDEDVNMNMVVVVVVVCVGGEE